ncbi:hypothetical protein L211DRAFT_871658 [Terfezia boudieri ATCC MYA-4762]|uniref:Uncharacterized protein n=1 Tax=Terfezia boudieri ATCC MYA-4762 TaxID=1051890 RepID=A0A3N4LB67_9PEZI|nr:hypothetical protein L211DRAFT_871658 [Terfezia boudieri ATCC MYA-4762]
MHLNQEPTLSAAVSKPAIPFFSTTSSSTHSSTPSATSFPTTTIPTSMGLKPSYLILDEDISCLDAFRILGRLVANVKCPLAEYSPVRAIPGARIPGLDESSPKSSGDAVKRQSTSVPEATDSSNSTSGSSGASSNRTLTDGEFAGDEADFAQELEKYESILVFSNLPLTVSSSTTATITHRSQYSKRTNSLLTAVLGIFISSSVNLTTTYRLDSPLIRTLSLTQQDLVWAALLGHDEYKRDVMTAVRRNGGKMFLVIGVKVARNADVQKEVSRGKVVSGKLQVDAGSGVGVQGLARVERVAGGKNGEGVNIGVVGSHVRGVVDEGGRKERLPGDRAFAVEYREVRLRLKLEIRGSKGREEKPSRQDKRDSWARKRWYSLDARSRSTYSDFERPYRLPRLDDRSTDSDSDTYCDADMYCDTDMHCDSEMYWSDFDYYINEDKHQINIDGGDEYELELKEEVYVQDIDAL